VQKTLRSLMPHQEEAVEYCLQQTNPALFMEMRLGKTLSIIRWVKIPREQRIKRILVVAPLTVLSSWEKELRLEQERTLLLRKNNQKGSLSILEKAKIANRLVDRTRKRLWFLVNYEALRLNPSLAYYDWDLVVLDESTKIKNPKAKISKLCVTSFKHARHRAILSGLPAPESASELVMQFLFLDGVFTGETNYWRWRNKYMTLDYVGKWKMTMYGLNMVKRYVEDRAFIRNRKQCNVGSVKVYQQRNIPMPPALSRAYKHAKKTFEIQLADGTIESTQWQIVLEMWLSRLAGGFDPSGNLISEHKYLELLDIIQNIPDEQVVVWFRFNAEIEYGKRFLAKHGIRAETITGDDSYKKRAQVLSDFSEKKYKVLLAQIACAKYGVDCSSADTAIYYSNSWSNEARTQSEDRIVHPSKTAPILYIDLITGSDSDIDGKVVKALREKKLNASALLSSFRKFSNANVEKGQSNTKKIYTR